MQRTAVPADVDRGAGHQAPQLGQRVFVARPDAIPDAFRQPLPRLRDDRARRLSF